VVVAEPVVACGPVGGMLVRAIRAAQGSLERAPKPPDLWDVMRARVDRVFAEFLGGEDPLVWRGGAGPRDAA
jgi:hypothetical protein